MERRRIGPSRRGASLGALCVWRIYLFPLLLAANAASAYLLEGLSTPSLVFPLRLWPPAPLQGPLLTPPVPRGAPWDSRSRNLCGGGQQASAALDSLFQIRVSRLLATQREDGEEALEEEQEEPGVSWRLAGGLLQGQGGAPAAGRAERDFSWGTRKQSYARVRLVEGSGRLLINNREGEEYLQGNDFWLLNCRAPLIEAKVEQKYDIQAQARGGGLGGQSGAIMLAVARELCRQQPELRPALKRAGFLTVDSRRVERKKFGLKKARKRPQYSKR